MRRTRVAFRDHRTVTDALRCRRPELVALAISSLLVLAASSAIAQEDTPPLNFKVAFIADQGLGSDSEAVLQLIKDEGADAVMHQGDFDYNDNPQAWEDQINATLGPDFPYFCSVGNHDDSDFYGSGGYQQFMEARLNRLGIRWQGDLGVQSTLKYAGIFMVMTAPGILGDGDDVYAPYIAQRLAADDSIWSVSSWHENQNLMQVGGKSDETGWKVYEEARRGGAIIATGHEHSYARTHLLSDCENQTVASRSNTLVLATDNSTTAADEGRSFAFQSGLGGASIRDQEISGDWWAAVYTSNQGANFGALFGVFNYNGDPRLAHFYFKDIDGFMADDFFVRSTVGGDGGGASSTTSTTVEQSTTTTVGGSTTTSGGSSTTSIEVTTTTTAESTTTTTIAVCANNVVEGSEECDDGNLVDGDGCDSNCTFTACGNGVATGTEQCDDGAEGSDCCSTSCAVLDTDDDGDCDRDDPCPNITATGGSPVESVKKVQLKYRRSGPGGDDDKIRLVKVDFATSTPFNPATSSDVEVRLLNTGRGGILYRTTLQAGKWEQAKRGRKKWWYRESANGLVRALLKAQRGSPNKYRFMMVASATNVSSSQAPLTILSDDVGVTLELESGADGTCFQATLGTCTSHNEKDRCSSP